MLKGGNIIFPPFLLFPTWPNSWCRFTSSVAVTTVRSELQLVRCRIFASTQLVSSLFIIPVLSLAQVARKDAVIFDASRIFKDPTNFNIIISDKVA